MSDYPIVALVGRPNVGKSTLFNRIIGRRLAVVHDRPGTTRDRQQADTDWRGFSFTLVDTGGIEALDKVSNREEVLAEDSAQFVREIRAQAEIAIADADVIVLVVDLLTGVTSADEHVAEILRRTNKPVIVTASKGDNLERHINIGDFYTLGIGDEVIPVSGLHGLGVGDLLDAIVEALPRKPLATDEDDEDILKVAILGRPNVGKSSLLNRLLGEERAIVSPVAGTTRDAIDTHLTWYGEPLILIDTAGIRRRGKIDPGVEKYSVLRALRAIKRADVALLLLDATEGVTLQDAHVAGFILDEMKSVIVLVNKWDAIEKDTYTMEAFTDQVREALKFMPYVPVMFISALTGQRVSKVIPLAFEIHEERFTRLPTSEVNRIVRNAVAQQSPPSKGGKRLKIRYASQVDVDPPKFLFHVNDMRLVHFSYQRYLENQLRAAHPFAGTPIRMSFKEGEDRRK